MYNWQLTTRQLHSLLDNVCAKNEECGCQLAIYCNGELLVDIASGVTVPEKGECVSPDHLFPLFSCGKALLATAVPIFVCIKPLTIVIAR